MACPGGIDRTSNLVDELAVLQAHHHHAVVVGVRDEQPLAGSVHRKLAGVAQGRRLQRTHTATAAGTTMIVWRSGM